VHFLAVLFRAGSFFLFFPRKSFLSLGIKITRYPKLFYKNNLPLIEKKNLFLFPVIDDRNWNLPVYRNAGVATTAGAKAL
jgi:hypothetical protein